MSAATPLRTLDLPLDQDRQEPIEVTLLELVQAVNEVAETEDEVVATVIHMMHSGSVRLCGNFRGSRIELDERD